MVKLLKRYKVAIIPTLVIATLSIALLTAASFVAASIAKPNYIYTVDDLLKIRNNLSGYFVLKNNLDLSKIDNYEITGWIPIGDERNPFSGTFDANGYSIYNCKTNVDYLLQNAYKDSNTCYLGFFGYSTGTIIHTNLNSPSLSFLETTSAFDKTIWYGCICGYNLGHITSSSVTYTNSSGTFKIDGINFGGVAGFNDGQLLRIKTINNLFLEINETSNCVGGIASSCGQHSVCKYIVKTGAISLSVKKDKEIIIGDLFGQVSGGLFENICSGSDVKQQYKPTLEIKNSSTMTNAILGKFCGLVNVGENVQIKNFYTESNTLFLNPCDNLSFGFMFGRNISSNINISSSVLMGEGSFSKIIGGNLGIVVGNNEIDSISASQVYCCNASNVDDRFNLSFCEIKNPNEISLSNLGWPTNTSQGYWEKEGNRFCLKWV